ncbi:MAG TPA: hypothetical protein VGI47_11965 [Candidatus Binataceae bacterium]|jgi:uncharacterized membrane protein
MTRVTILLTLVGLTLLFVAFGKGISAVHGGDVLSHMYWATAALMAVMGSNLFAVAHLARCERIIRRLRARCEERGVPFEDID